MCIRDRTKDLNLESSNDGSGDDDVSDRVEDRKFDGENHESDVDDNSDNNNEFTGFSEEETNEHSLLVKPKMNKPKVIKFDGPTDTYIAPSNKEKKLLSSGKTLIHAIVKEQEQEDRDDKKDLNENLEEENLQNDIELQQFLRESHLLSAFSNASSGVTSGVGLTLEGMHGSNSDTIAYQDDQVIGKARSRTLEMRLKHLSKVNGHTSKISKLEKVPIQVRKGMIEKHKERIKRYEQDAAEGGIVLSRVKKGQFRKIESTYKKDIERRIGESIKKKDEERMAKRERGLKINTIGRSTRNGLIVSKDEIERIGGGGMRGRGGFRGRGGGRGGRGGGRGGSRGGRGNRGRR